MNVAPTDEYVVQVDGLRTRFGAAVVHDGVSLAVRRGEIFALVGGSGCGKSTLLREVLLLQAPEAGSIRVFGREVVGLNDSKAARSRGQRTVGCEAISLRECHVWMGRQCPDEAVAFSPPAMNHVSRIAL